MAVPFLAKIARKFLNRFGAWNCGKVDGEWMRDNPAGDGEDRRAFSTFIESPQYFWSFLNLLKLRIEQATADASTWFDGLEEFPRVEQIPTFPYFFAIHF
jgi:hypothetical protein